MTDWIQLGREALAKQPFSVLLQAELVSYAEGVAELKIPITEQVKQQHGFVHGGVVSYLADNALTYAGACVLGWAVVTAEFKINYLRPAMGTALIARASACMLARHRQSAAAMFLLSARKASDCVPPRKAPLQD